MDYKRGINIECPEVAVMAVVELLPGRYQLTVSIFNTMVAAEAAFKKLLTTEPFRALRLISKHREPLNQQKDSTMTTIEVLERLHEANMHGYAIVLPFTELLDRKFIEAMPTGYKITEAGFSYMVDRLIVQRNEYRDSYNECYSALRERNI